MAASLCAAACWEVDMSLLDLIRGIPEKMGRGMERNIGGLLGIDPSKMTDEERKQARRLSQMAVFDAMARGTSPLSGLSQVAGLIGSQREQRQQQAEQAQRMQAAQQASGQITGRLLGGAPAPTAPGAMGGDDLTGVNVQSQYRRDPIDALRIGMSPAGADAMRVNPLLQAPLQAMLQPPEGMKPTSDITNFMFGASNPEFLQFLESANRAKAQNIKINTGESGELAAQKTIAETEAKILTDQQKAATSAARSWKAAQGLIDISSKPGAVSGALAPGIVGANNFLVSVFGRGVSTEDMADAQNFQAAVSRLFIEQMAALGGARGLSDSESRIVYAALPQLATSPQARIAIARLIQSKAEEAIEDYNQSYTNFREAFGNIKTGLKPVQKPSMIDEGRFQQWLNSPAGQAEMQNLIRGQQSR
jgi:hypothetical protein